MGNALVDRELEHLRVHHQEAHFLRRRPQQHRDDHRVDRHRLAGARGAGDQEMRHLRQVGDVRHAFDVLAEAHRQLAVRFLEGVLLDELAQHHGLALFVRDLDADDTLARDGRDDADAQRLHRHRQVVGQAGDAAHLDAGGGQELEHRHHRAGSNLGDLALDAERGELLAQLLRGGGQAVAIERQGRRCLAGENRDRRRHEGAVTGSHGEAARWLD